MSPQTCLEAHRSNSRKYVITALNPDYDRKYIPSSIPFLSKYLTLLVFLCQESNKGYARIYYSIAGSRNFSEDLQYQKSSFSGVDSLNIVPLGVPSLLTILICSNELLCKSA